MKQEWQNADTFDTVNEYLGAYYIIFVYFNSEFFISKIKRMLI